MKVDKQRFLQAIQYLKEINDAPFDSLDFSEFEKFTAVSPVDIADFRFTGLVNTDFVKIFLLENEDEA